MDAQLPTFGSDRPPDESANQATEFEVNQLLDDWTDDYA